MNNSNDIWVFGYGSLMWLPGFEYVEDRLAKLEGYHRDLCILSYVFRGTPEVPGLVMGLNAGGACHGRAFRVSAPLVEGTLAYLHEREMINSVYTPSWVEIELCTGQRTKAYTFLAIPGHEQHVSALSIEETCKLIMQGHGEGGSSVEYLENTLLHLRELGIEDSKLEAIFQAVCEPQI